MPITNSGWGDLLDPNFRRIFVETMGKYAETNDFVPRLYSIQTSTKASEKFSSAGALGPAKRLDLTGRVQYDQPTQGYDIEIEFPEYTNGFEVTRKMWDDEQHMVLERYPRELALSMERTRQDYAVLLFNNATSTTVSKDGFTLDISGGDGQALVADAHTHATGNTSAVDNYGTETSLTAAALDTARQAMHGFTDDRGSLLNVYPDTILIPRELEKTMSEIDRSDNVPAEMSNTWNFMSGRFGVMVWDLLTDADRWFMIDSARMKDHLFWFDRVRAEFNQVVDFDTLVKRWNAYARWGFGFDDWRWVYGMVPA